MKLPTLSRRALVGMGILGTAGGAAGGAFIGGRMGHREAIGHSYSRKQIQMAYLKGRRDAGGSAISRMSMRKKASDSSVLADIIELRASQEPTSLAQHALPFAGLYGAVGGAVGAGAGARGALLGAGAGMALGGLTGALLQAHEKKEIILARKLHAMGKRRRR